jgi:hypothetical protein
VINRKKNLQAKLAGSLHLVIILHGRGVFDSYEKVKDVLGTFAGSSRDSPDRLK